MMVVGDPSADLHVSHVVKAFKQSHPDSEIFGIGGEHMVAEGFETLFPLEKMAVMGFFEVIRHLHFFTYVSQQLISEIATRRPQVVVLVDYPGFNIRFAEQVRKRFPIDCPKLLYYISPQVWAWKPNRIKVLAKVIDYMTVVFPFEVEWYQNAGLPVEFVGHPLLDLPEPRSKEALFHQVELQDNDVPIALLPGSRIQEVNRHLPIFLKAFDQLQSKHPELFALIAASDHIPKNCYERFLINNKRCKVLYGWTREIMAHSRAAWVKSGTATLETATFGTPLVIAYKTNPFTFRIAKQLIKVPFIGMVNILAKVPVTLELVQNQVTAERLAQAIEPLIYNDEIRQQMISKLSKIKKQLGQPGAGKRVANKILELANAGR
jgi:lipid-A-disaccharide synthase